MLPGREKVTSLSIADCSCLGCERIHAAVMENCFHIKYMWVYIIYNIFENVTCKINIEKWVEK